ncbi:MAG: NAD(+) synthase [Clostridia bacterium]|nr:NAD(+) synthase [Clostridia bacterium]
MNNGFVKVASVTPSLKVADCVYNVKEIIALTHEIYEKGVSVIVFPELSLTGYTCGDLFLSRTLTDKAAEALELFLNETRNIDAIAVVGLPYIIKGRIFNCAAVCKCGELLGIIPKKSVLSHGELSEGRYFASASNDGMYVGSETDADVYVSTDKVFESLNMPGFCFSVAIGEDAYSSDTEGLCLSGACIIINPSASSETVGREEYRRMMSSAVTKKNICAMVTASAGVGESTTDLVFAGHDIIAECGDIISERKPFSSEKYIISEIDVDAILHDRAVNTGFDPREAASVCYFSHEVTETKLTREIDRSPFVPSCEKERELRAEKILNIQANGLARRLSAAYAKTAVIGISGGLDSTLALIVACRAMDILGRPRTDIIGVTMPCFGTTKRTKGNAEKLCEALGISFRTVNIARSVRMHFKDIGHSEDVHDVVYENSQARERTQVIMDISNATGGMVIGTGDLSELALGWATYNGDHMSMYGVNSAIPKTLVRMLVGCYAEFVRKQGSVKLHDVLKDILDTPVSPELLPANTDGTIAQVTEDLVGPYELHDFFIYNFLRHGYTPKKLLYLAAKAFEGIYDREFILKWLKVFFRRFFTQQFKRSCVPDGPKVGSVGLSPRGDLKMPSDASYALWLSELDSL